MLCRYAVQIVKPLVSKNKSEKLTIGTVNCNVLITSSCIVEENTKSRLDHLFIPVPGIETNKNISVQGKKNVIDCVITIF